MKNGECSLIIWCTIGKPNWNLYLRAVDESYSFIVSGSALYLTLNTHESSA